MEQNASDGQTTRQAPLSLTIREIQTIHGLITKAFLERDNLSLDFSDDVPVDISFVQLIESARLYADSNRKRISLSRPAGENIRRVLERGGFLSGVGPDTRRFWLHEEVTS
jgi:hypothetical protein